MSPAVLRLVGATVAPDAPVPSRPRRALRARVQRDLDDVTKRVVAAFGANLVALLLVGGYARGEGGALGEGPDAPAFNDYDLVVVLGEVDARAFASATEVGRDATKRHGVDVDIWPISRAAIAHPPATLFWLDVALGGVVVLHGDPAILSGVRTITPRSVPLEEAGRLLANRATGLALSRLEGPARDPLATAKHIYKMVLACGDARLLASAEYAPTTMERGAKLDEAAMAGVTSPALARAYRAAMAFRARPDVAERPREVGPWFDAWRQHLSEWHLGFEAYRLGGSLSVRSYVRRHGPLFARRVDGMRFGLPSALRAAFRRQAPLFPYVGHPRERLARASVALAYLPLSEALREASRLMAIPEHEASPRAIREALLRLRDAGS